jgi:hypothetical protein
MSSYATGKIYKITSPHTDMIYIGSTIQSLHLRMIGHKSDFKHQKSNSSKPMFDSGDPQIELIEIYPCNSKRELESREQYYIELYKERICNKHNAVFEDKKAYRKAYMRSERGIAQRQKWRENNKQRLNNYNKKRRETYGELEKKKKKEDYEKNREKILIRKKQYHKWIHSMGGNYRYNNNLTKIDPTLFS